MVNQLKVLYLLHILCFLGMSGQTQKYTLPKQIIKIVGHDPHVKVIKEERGVVNYEQDRVTIFLHGYGDSGRRIKMLAKDLLAGNILVFNFSDSYFNYIKSNLGQLGDVLTALCVIKHVALDQLNVKIIDLHGMSRGGAVVVNMLSVLNNPEKYYNELALIGIEQKDCTEILSHIQLGSHVLHIPLKSPQLIVPFMSNGFAQNALSKLSRFEKNGLDPMEEIKHIPKDLTMLVHFQKNDKIVGNKDDDLYFAKLAQKSPEKTYLCIGKDGGHVASSAFNYKSLLQTIHYYKKLCGGAYNFKYIQNQPYHLICARDIGDIKNYFSEAYLKKIKKREISTV